MNRSLMTSHGRRTNLVSKEFKDIIKNLIFTQLKINSSKKYSEIFIEIKLSSINLLLIFRVFMKINRILTAVFELMVVIVWMKLINKSGRDQYSNKIDKIL